MKEKIVEISSLRALRNLTRAISARSYGSPGIGVVSGEVGRGKTCATQFVCLAEDGIWITAHPESSPNWLYGDIAVELGAARRATTRENFSNAVGALKARPRAIFIDESDFLVSGTPRLQKVESLRALHDATQAPLILIGMSQLPRAIRALPQLERRVAQRLEFQPCDLRDTRLMADELLEIELSDELVREIHRATAGSANSIHIALERLENLARRRVKRKLHLSDVPEDFALVPEARKTHREPARADSSNVVSLRPSVGANA